MSARWQVPVPALECPRGEPFSVRPALHKCELAEGLVQRDENPSLRIGGGEDRGLAWVALPVPDPPGMRRYGQLYTLVSVRSMLPKGALSVVLSNRRPASS